RWAFWGSLVGLGPLVLFYLIPRGLGGILPLRAAFSALTLAVLPLTLSGSLFRIRRGDFEGYLRRGIGLLSTIFLTFAVSSAAWVLIDGTVGPALDLSEWAVAGWAALIGG